MEICYAEHCTGGDCSRARLELRGGGVVRGKWSKILFANGWVLGFSIGLYMLVFVLAGTSSAEDGNWGRYQSIFLLYRLSFFPILMIWLFGLNNVGFKRYSVNYPFIFEHVGEDYLAYPHIFTVAAFLTLFHAISVTIYAATSVFVVDSRLDPVWQPFILNCFYLLFLFNPFNFGWKRTRYWLLHSLTRLIRSPFFRVRFGDFFLADQLTSMVLVFYDLEFFLCFSFLNIYVDDESSGDSDSCLDYNQYARPALAAIPSFWRMMQCFRRFFFF